MYYHSTMSLRSVMIQLRDDQIERLDAEAARTGASRSRVIRTAVDGLFDRPFDVSVAERYQRAYPEPRYGVDAWGDLVEWHDAAERDEATFDWDPP